MENKVDSTFCAWWKKIIKNIYICNSKASRGTKASVTDLTDQFIVFLASFQDTLCPEWTYPLTVLPPHQSVSTEKLPAKIRTSVIHLCPYAGAERRLRKPSEDGLTTLSDGIYPSSYQGPSSACVKQAAKCVSLETFIHTSQRSVKCVLGLKTSLFCSSLSESGLIWTLSLERTLKPDSPTASESLFDYSILQMTNKLWNTASKYSSCSLRHFRN